MQYRVNLNCDASINNSAVFKLSIYYAFSHVDQRILRFRND